MVESFSSQAAGALQLDEHFGDSWAAIEPLALPFFNGQQVAVSFEGGATPSQHFTQAADGALLNFLSLSAADRLAATDAVFANYQQVLAWAGQQLALNEPSDVWRYVTPQHLHIIEESDEAQRDIYLLIEAECEWEVEHGLQLVFRQGRMLTRVSQYDGHLTESQAEDIPEDKDDLMMQYYAKFGRSSIH